MWATKRVLAAVFMVASAFAGVVIPFAGALAGPALTDPYEILDRYFEASGGLERLRGERTAYSEGTLAVGGMEGTIKVWTAKPDRSRAEIQVGPISITEGDNGELSWVLDTNGKLQTITKSDEITLKRKEVERRVAEYEYADPGSDVFTVTLEGTEKVGEKDCYLVKVANSINSDHYTYFVGIDDFRLWKAIAIKGEKSSETFHDDYREVAGIQVAFHTKEVPYQTGQPLEVALTVYESNPDVPPGIFDPPEVAGKDYEFMAGNAAEDIPFKFIGNHLYIPVKVNGTERMWILDTGAGMSVIDKAFAQEMALELEGNLTGRGAGGTVEASFTVLPPYELKGIGFGQQTVAVIDMGELIRRLGIDIAGILGYDFLSRFITKVDYANELVSFYEPEAFRYAGDGHVIDAHIKESVFEVSATLDGEHSGTWLFDLGAGMTHLDGIYALREGYTKRDGVLRMGHGAGNEFQLKAVEGERIQFAGFTVDEPEISFAYGGTDTVFTADKIGILGNSLFRNFILYVDYGNERVIVEEGDKFNQPWPRDNSGLNIAWTVDRDGVEVMYVSPDTPGQQAGFQEGDILRSVNGVGIEDAGGIIGVRELLEAKAGTRHEIVVEREGRERMLELELADLY
jgi:hypothetical protein